MTDDQQMACASETWVTRVAGIDPGFISTAVVVLEEREYLRPVQTAREVVVIEWQVFRTAKMKQKERSNLRVTNDDVRRYTEIFVGVRDMLIGQRVRALGVEAYRVAPRFGRRKGPPGGQPAGEGAEGQDSGGAGAGAKTMAVYGGVLAVGVALGLYVTPWLPNDLKKRFTGRQSSSKEDVWESICREVQGASKMIDNCPKSLREHVGDAAGHAVLTLEEARRIRKFVGGGAL